MNTERMQVSLDAETHLRMVEFAKSIDRTIVWCYRRAIQDFLEKYKNDVDTTGR